MQFWIPLINYYLFKAISCFWHYTHIQMYMCAYICTHIKNTHTHSLWIVHQGISIQGKLLLKKKVSAAPLMLNYTFSLEDADHKRAGLAFSVQILSVCPKSSSHSTTFKSRLSTSNALLFQILAGYFWFTNTTSHRSGSKYLQLIHQILKIPLSRLKTSTTLF